MWPLDRLRRKKSRQLKDKPKKSGKTVKRIPFVLVEKGRHGIEVVAANEAAQSRNIYSGLAFTDARARTPDLVFEEIDRVADRNALQKLADWMVRFSPRVSTDGNDAIVMEITGLDHLFGGEAKLMERIRACLQTNGYISQIAIAGTFGAANALARYRINIGDVFVSQLGHEKQDLADLSVKALRLSDKTVQLLRKFGLTRIDQLYGLDRKALTRRFASREAADAVVLRLDQALGIRHEPIKPVIAEPEWAMRMSCPEPVAAQDGVEYALDHLLSQLCHKLDMHGVGARDFCLYAFGVDGKCSHISASSASAVRDANHIRRLLKEHVETINPGFGIDLFMLSAARIEGLDHDAKPLAADMVGGFDEEAFIRLADRLAVRLGEKAVQMPIFHESHVPERSESFSQFATHLMEARSLSRAMGPRPLRMFEMPEHVEVMAEVPDGPPARLIWRRVMRKIVRADGPERIAPEWWKLSEKGARARDYYRIEDEEGCRYWIYRHGLYDDNRGGPPQWYMHGVFA
ncbi:Y-family DNA polymerase [Hirschia baltica]|uniref:Y-family DNA polymerase n=1 Tax=Hirschia baltica TaxID=2724 RepID=UPI000A02C2AA|nr:DNA polymerase Y family protein [Hirschia baltica]